MRDDEYLTGPLEVREEQEYDLEAADIKHANLYAILDCKSLGALMACAGILLSSNGVNEDQKSRVLDAYLKALIAFGNKKGK